MRFLPLERTKTHLIASLLFLFCFSWQTSATDGYFSNGSGTRNKGFAGAGIAYLQGPFAAAVNPASIAFLYKKFSIEVSVGLFNPNRQYKVTGAATPPQFWPYEGRQMLFGLTEGTVKSETPLFLIPAIAMAYQLDDRNSIGFNFYGNGGMNTDYNTRTYYSAIIDGFGNPLPNQQPNPMTNVSTPSGVNLQQMFLALTYSRKLGNKHSIGLSPILAYQNFEATGLEAFRDMGMAGNPMLDGVNRMDYVTNKGVSNSFGIGFRIGYQGELYSGLRLGASFQPKINMSEFDEYKGLFAEEGDFDIPANWTIGLAYDITKNFTLLVDIKQIYYSQINSIGNPMIPNQMIPMIPNPNMSSPEDAYIPNPDFIPLGEDKAAGFGWEDMLMIKAGVESRILENWQFRAGYSYGKEPIPGNEVMFNILAPAVNENHISMGITHLLGDQSLHLAITHALANSVKGPNPFDPSQEIELEMNQWEFEIGFSF